jgi:hypothetical protein
MARSLRSVALVSVSLSSTNAIVRRGKKAAVIVLVRGTAEPVELDVRSLTPQIAQFARGDDMSVRTNGGVDNAAVVQLKGVGAGAFSLAVNLKNILASINAPVARDFLEAARKIARPNTAEPIGIILQKLSTGHVDAQKMQRELQSISAERSSRDFQALVNAACRALAGE